MRKIIPLIFSIFSAITLLGQANGGWGICEFSTVAAMDAYDPSGSTFSCKKVYVQATDEHYRWDGSIWVLESSDVENLYNTSDTLSADRTLEGDANSLFFTGLDSMYIEGTNIELDASNIITFFAENTIEFELDATDGKGIYIASDGDVGIGTSSPDAKLDVEGGTVRFSDYGAGSESGTETYLLGVDTDGDVVEVDRSIDAHSDVDITTTTPSSGDLLIWDGSNFVPQDTDNGYTIFNIWAEESASLGANNYEWAFGNGDNTPNGDGIVIPIDCELFAMSLNHEGGANTTVRIVINTDASQSTYQVSTSGAENGYNTFGTPLSFSAGDIANFRTISASTGGTSGRISAWFRVRSTPASTSLLNDLLDVSAGSITSNQILQYNGASFVPIDLSAANVSYDNATSGLTATTTQAAIDELAATSGADNLGDHTATQNIELDGNWLSGDGGNEGVYVEADGDVGIGTSSPDAKLDIEGGQVRFSDYGSGTYEDTTAVYLLGVESDGDIVEMNTAKSSRIFYPPALVIDASSTGSGLTLDLHQQYIDLFGAPAVASSGAPSVIPTYAETELYYYVTDYDNTIFSNLSISAAGVLTYDIDAVPTDNCAVLNVVFVVKEP